MDGGNASHLVTPGYLPEVAIKATSFLQAEIFAAVVDAAFPTVPMSGSTLAAESAEEEEEEEAATAALASCSSAADEEEEEEEEEAATAAPAPCREAAAPASVGDADMPAQHRGSARHTQVGEQAALERVPVSCGRGERRVCM